MSGDHLTRAGEHLRRGALAEARAACEAAVAAQPENARAHALLAHTLAKLGDNDAAWVSVEHALQRDTTLAPAWLLRAMLAWERARPDLAREAYARVLATQPDHVLALEGYAQAQRACSDDLGPVLQAQRRLCALRPDNLDDFLRYAYSCVRVEDYTEATKALARAHELGPAHPMPRWAGALTPPAAVFNDTAQIDAYRAQYRRELDALAQDLTRAPPAPDLALTALLFGTNLSMHYVCTDDRADQTRYACVVKALSDCALRTIRPATPRTPRARPRIGFVSALFRDHTVMRLFADLILGLDAERFESTLFWLDTHDDAVARHLLEHPVAHVRGERTPQQWLDALCAADLDVLIYVDLGMHPLSTALAAQRAAPVQAALWGHPITTELDTIDAFFVPDALEPADETLRYRERVLRLPGLGACYGGPPRLGIDAVQPARAPRYALIAQNAAKILPDFDATLARLAAALPDWRFVLRPSARISVCDALRTRLAHAFSAYGADAARQLDVARFLPEAEFHALAAGAYLNLDTPNWSGGLTSLDLLWLGLPTVCYEGDTLRGAQTSGLLRMLEFPQGIARDHDDYVARVLALANDAALRERARDHLLARRGRLTEHAAVHAAFAAYLRALADGA
jgi:predicted O-linked N-acetylglucosamine transferase (SPINDLY family)